MISQKLIERIKLSKRKNYQIALAAGIHPSTLSRIVNGIERVRDGDRRVAKIGKIVGMKKGDCFE